MEYKKALMIILLIVLAVMMRMTFREPHHPDHYIWGSYTYAVIENGYAPWVLHPMSLFGYYPMSFASGLEFFAAYMHNLTGLDLPGVFYLFSIFSGLYGGLTLYVMMRHWTIFETSFLASMVLMTMAFFIKVTANTASTRISNIMFYPLFILLLFKIYAKFHEKRRICIKSIIGLIILTALMAIMHRLAQLLIIFLASYVLALLMMNWKRFYKLYRKSHLYKVRQKHYLHSKMYIAVDLMVAGSIFLGWALIHSWASLIGFLIFTIGYYIMMNLHTFKDRTEIMVDMVFYAAMLVAAKAADLAWRHRLFVHVAKLLPGLDPFAVFFMIIIILMMLVFLYIGFHIYYHKALDFISLVVDIIVKRSVSLSTKYPDIAVSICMFMVFIMLSLATFQGKAFISVDRTPYYSSYLLQGTGSLVVLFNWLLNINNNLTVLVWFAFFGIVYLFFKKDKLFYHYYFAAVALGFCQFIFDWEYIRLYMNPLYALYIAVGLSVFLRLFTKHTKLKKAVDVIFILIFAVHLIFSGLFMQREYFLTKLGISKEYERIQEDQLKVAGKYLNIPGDFSIISSSDRFRIPPLAYYSHKIGAVSSQSTYVKPELYNITDRTFSMLWEDFRNGEKITDLWRVKDWLLGGTYYHGRHVRFFQGSNIENALYRRVISDYNIAYSIDSDLTLDRFAYFGSVRPYNNLVYSTDSLDIFDLSNGRVDVT